MSHQHSHPQSMAGKNFANAFHAAVQRHLGSHFAKRVAPAKPDGFFAAQHFFQIHGTVAQKFITRGVGQNNAALNAKTLPQKF